MSLRRERYRAEHWARVGPQFAAPLTWMITARTGKHYGKAKRREQGARSGAQSWKGNWVDCQGGCCWDSVTALISSALGGFSPFALP